MDEDFVNDIPGASIVITMVLEGDLSINELRNVFGENVFEARCKLNPDKIRYPELKQHLSTFLGFRIWKNVSSFSIEDHVKECIVDHFQFDGKTLGDIHQKYLNKPFKKLKSPWELVLVRNTNNNKLDFEEKCVLVFRLHHVMADAKSVLKLLVECLGRKKLKTARFADYEESSWSKLKFVLAFPKNLFLLNVKFWTSVYQNSHHPWSNMPHFGKTSKENLKMVVALSPKLKMSDIKNVALKNNVKGSAVVMSIIAGAIKHNCVNQWNKSVDIGYILPRPNHPETLTNHAYTCFLSLPTDQNCRLKRLQLCNQRFLKTKLDKQFRYTDLCCWIGGILMYPISRILTTFPLPIGITNIAGEEEGFSVGKAECIDFCMSVGTFHKCVGVVFCTMSYKGGLKIAVIAKESILTNEDAENIAQHLALELKLFMENCEKSLHQN